MPCRLTETVPSLGRQPEFLPLPQQPHYLVPDFGG